MVCLWAGKQSRYVLFFFHMLIFPLCARAEPGSEISFQGPRLTVFIMGGLTFSEMAAAYECTKQYNRQVVIGMPFDLPLCSRTQSFRLSTKCEFGAS